MSDFNQYARINDKYNNDPLQGADARKAQIYNRNASSFNPIGFDPNPQNPYDDGDKRKQKEKQNLYKEQLDAMAKGTQGKPTYEKNSTEGYGGQYGNVQADVRREAEQRYPQPGADDQRRVERNNEGAYAQEQYRKPVDYERAQPQPVDCEKNYGQQQQPQYQQYQQQQHHQAPEYQQEQAYRAPESYKRQHSPEKPLKAHNQEVDKYAVTAEAKHDTFEQQDYLREQLLAKIKSGYTPSNARVYDAYQRAYEQKEKEKEIFEKNVVEKAAKEKVLKEDYRAMVEHDQKKRLQKDTLMSNQNAVESKASQEKRKKALETAAEAQRIQDSLSQFERQNFQQKEALRKRQQDNARVLELQRKEIHERKGEKGYHDVRPGQNVKRDSIDQFTYERSNNITPLQPSNTRANDSPVRSQSYGKNPYERVTASMENLSLKQPYGQQDNYGPGYSQEQPRQPYEQSKQPYGQPDNYVPGYSQEQSYQPYGKDIGTRGKSQERSPYQAPYQAPQDLQYSQGPQNPRTTDYNAKNEYQKIRDRNRYGTNFNIISNEMS